MAVRRTACVGRVPDKKLIFLLADKTKMMSLALFKSKIGDGKLPEPFTEKWYGIYSDNPQLYKLSTDEKKQAIEKMQVPRHVKEIITEFHISSKKRKLDGLNNLGMQFIMYDPIISKGYEDDVCLCFTGDSPIIFVVSQIPTNVKSGKLVLRMNNSDEEVKDCSYEIVGQRIEFRPTFAKSTYDSESNTFKIVVMRALLYDAESRAICACGNKSLIIVDSEKFNECKFTTIEMPEKFQYDGIKPSLLFELPIPENLCSNKAIFIKMPGFMCNSFFKQKKDKIHIRFEAAFSGEDIIKVVFNNCYVVAYKIKVISNSPYANMFTKLTDSI